MGGGSALACPGDMIYLGDSLSVENAQGSIDYNWFPDSNLTNPTSANPYFKDYQSVIDNFTVEIYQ